MTPRQEQTINVAFENQSKVSSSDLRFILSLKEQLQKRPLMYFSSSQKLWLYRIWEKLLFEGLVEFEQAPTAKSLEEQA